MYCKILRLKYIKVHTATRWTIRHSLKLHWFADLLNVTEEVTIHRPNDKSVETLGLWIVTSSVTLIKSANQCSFKLCHLEINPNYSITFQNGGFWFPCSFYQKIQENYSEDKINAVLMTVFLSQAVSPLSQFDCYSCIQSSTQHWQQ